MLLERIESPVPDSTETPARTLKAIVLPAPETVPPIVLFGCVVADDHAVDLVAQWCLAGDVGADQVALDQVVAVAGRRRAARPSGWPRSGSEAAAVVPPMVLPGAPRIATPSWALGIAYSPVLSVPIRLPCDQVPGGRSLPR